MKQYQNMINKINKEMRRSMNASTIRQDWTWSGTPTLNVEQSLEDENITTLIACMYGETFYQYQTSNHSISRVSGCRKVFRFLFYFFGKMVNMNIITFSATWYSLLA
jgi:hypothetical protein